METRENVHQSLEARLDELNRQMDQIADKAAHASAEAETRRRAQLGALRTRLAKVRAQLRANEEADDRAQKIVLSEINREITSMYEELASRSK